MTAPQIAHAPAGPLSPLRPGDQVSVFLCGTLTANGFVRIPGGAVVYVPPEVPLIPGDVTPTLQQGLKDAIQFRDCGSTPECLGWTAQYDALLMAAGEA